MCSCILAPEKPTWVSSSDSCQPTAVTNRCPLLQFGFWRVVLDEAQLVATTSSVAAQMTSSLWRRHAWVVTGTPITARLEEIQVRHMQHHPSIIHTPCAMPGLSQAPPLTARLLKRSRHGTCSITHPSTMYTPCAFCSFGCSDISTIQNCLVPGPGHS